MVDYRNNSNYVLSYFFIIGFAIWTDRSTDEILKEAKKSQAASSMSVPPNVALVLTAVYLDRTVTLKEIRAEEDLLYMEYRKWFRERRKQLKKDPVPMSAAQLSRVSII